MIASVDADVRARTTFAVGVDPGTSTGLVVLRGDGFRPHVQQGTPSQVLDDLTIRLPFLLNPAHDVLVACERYVQDATNHKTAQSTPHEVIGVVQQLARTYGWSFHLQSPGDVKALVDNETLRRTGLWVTPSDVEQRDADDANDATRHALAVLAYRRATLFERILTNIGA